MRSILGISKKPNVQTYRGFGSKSSFHVSGRVTETIPNYRRDETSSFQNIKQIFATYLAKPYVCEEITVVYNNQEYRTETDVNGFFEIIFVPKEITFSKDAEWITVQVILSSTGDIVDGEVLLEGAGNTYGIISDIDDTILVSNVSSKIKLVYNTLTKSASRRIVFNGVQQLYKSLVKGSDGVSRNPIIYVSSSHWNLYPFLTHFFTLNDLPRGPLQLKKFLSIRALIKQRKNHNHKKAAIEKVIETYPALTFVLLGDSGEQDVTIYTKIAKKYPGKIKAILIREVKSSKKHTTYLVQNTDSSIPIYSSKNSSQLLEYARSKKLVM